MKNTNSYNSNIKFKEVSKICRQTLYDYHENKLISICNSKNIKTFYSFINKKFGRVNLSPKLKSINSVILNDNECANCFVEYFLSVYSVDDGSLPQMETKCLDVIEPIIFNEDIIIKSWHALPNKISCGPDGIPSILLKNISDAISLPLSIIFQKSYNLGKLLNLWKIANIILILANTIPIPTANVCPIYKRKGDKTNPSSYRPVSMCSAAGKIFEHIVNKKLCAHLDRYNIISARQHGFVRGHSVTTNLLSAYNVITDCVNTGTPYDVITLDMARALDKVPHAMLVEVLSSISLHQ